MGEEKPTRKQTADMAVLGFVLNLFVPGLGSLINRRHQGYQQIFLVVMAVLLYGLYILPLIVPNMLFLITAAALFIVAWIWALITSIYMIFESGSNNNKKPLNKQMQKIDNDNMAKEVTIKRIDPWSLAKVYSVIMAIVGFILGLILSLVFLSLGSFMGGFGLMGFGVLSIIVLPIIFGILGLVIGAISAVLYNVIAGWIGGVKVEVEK